MNQYIIYALRLYKHYILEYIYSMDMVILNKGIITFNSYELSALYNITNI